MLSRSTARNVVGVGVDLAVDGHDGKGELLSRPLPADETAGKGEELGHDLVDDFPRNAVVEKIDWHQLSQKIEILVPGWVGGEHQRHPISLQDTGLEIPERVIFDVHGRIAAAALAEVLDRGGKV